jgi:hypothetical protein
MTSATSSADALAERLFGATLGALELFSVYLGVELGLYEALADRGPLRQGELARRAGIVPRYGSVQVLPVDNDFFRLYRLDS